MGLFTQRCFQIRMVQLQDLRIFVGESDRRVRVQLPELIAAESCQFHPFVDGLPAASGASAGTGHDFDGVVGRSAGADLFDQPAGVTQPVCDADFDGYAVEVDRRRTDSRQSAQFGEVEFRKRFFRLYFVCRTHGCLWCRR